MGKCKGMAEKTRNGAGKTCFSSVDNAYGLPYTLGVMIDRATAEKIKPGARVRVWERIKEGDKERESPFEGVVLARKHGSEPGATFTVRAVLQEVGVEKVYPLHAPTIARVQVLASPKKVHRSKLYYLRGFSSKRSREHLIKK